VQVTLTLDVLDGETSDFNIEESIPADATLSDVQASAGEATVADNMITWTGSGFSGEATLTYTLSYEPEVIGHQEISATFDDGADYSGITGLDVVEIGVFNVTDYGMFAGSADVGAVGATGMIGTAGDKWIVVGSGADIWGTADEFHFLYFQT